MIPPLVDSLRKQKGDPVAGASELLLSFVAAFEHIPSHRRFRLFHSLVNKLGSDDFLFALLVMLADKYPSNKKVTQFAVDLASRYSAETQLKVSLSSMPVTGMSNNIADRWEVS